MVKFDPESGNVNFNPYSFISRPCFAVLLFDDGHFSNADGEQVVETYGRGVRLFWKEARWKHMCLIVMMTMIMMMIMVIIA